MRMKPLEIKEEYGADDIARRICSKYKGLAIPDIRVLIGLLADEIGDILVNEEATVVLRNLCRFGINEKEKVGVNFNDGNKRIHYGKFKYIEIKPTKNIKQRFEDIANAENWERQRQINKEIGYVSPQLDRIAKAKERNAKKSK